MPEEPHISRFVKRHLPHASPQELHDAQENLDAFFVVLYRICERIEHDRQVQARDKTNGYVSVGTPAMEA